MTSVVSQLSSILRLLQLAGLYPRPVPFSDKSDTHWIKVLILLENNHSLQTCEPAIFQKIAFIAQTLLCLAVDAALTGYNGYGFSECLKHFGMLNAITVSTIITGLLPLHNAATVFVFSVLTNRHTEYLSHLERGIYRKKMWIKSKLFPGNCS